MTGAERIAVFAEALDPRAVPEDVVKAARLHFLDAVGVGIAASVGPDQSRWSDAVEPGGRNKTLAGGAASAADAAMLNGALIHSLEYDDTHIGSVIHGSAVAAPVALAAAEETGAGDAGTMAAYLIAWEVMIRLGLTAPGAVQAHGAQVTAVAGAIGAAAAAGRLYGLAGRALVSAIGIAGMQASGLLAFLEDGSSAKALNPGWAAHTGLVAARLAGAGMTGPAGILEHPFGPLRVFGADPSGLADTLDDLGRRWHLPDAAFKLYPCCHYIHPFLELVETRAADGLSSDNLERMDVHVPVEEAPLVADPWDRRQAPASGYDGKWGLPYCLALQLVDGRVDVASFEAPPRDEVVTVARRMRMLPVEGSGFPACFPAWISCRLRDGRDIEAAVDTVRGAPGRPIGQDEVVTKFRANAARRIDADRAERLIWAVTGGAIDDAPGLLRS